MPTLRVTLAAVSTVAAVGALADDWPTFADENLTVGRAVWLQTCEGCHGYGIAGAPLAADADAWRPRIEKGRAALYQHAIEGFFGPRGTMMPERGGNPDLTDAEVRLAVDYMVALVATDPD